MYNEEKNAPPLAPPPPPGLGNKTTITNLFCGNGENYRPSVLWKTWCTIPLGLVASGDSASGRPQPLGAIVFTVAQKGM